MMIPANEGEATTAHQMTESPLPELSEERGHVFLGLLWGVPLSMALWIAIALVWALA